MERRIKKILEKKSGFILMEMMVALFIFALIVGTIVTVFITSYKSQEKAKTLQKDLENVRVAIETMAKNIRTSTLDGSDADVSGEAEEIYVYDYSQEKCIGYKFDNMGSGKKTLNFLEEELGRLNGLGEIINCQTELQGESFYPLISDTELNQANFLVKETGATEMGQVTIIIQIEEDSLPFETTVSLRDY